MTGMMAAPIFIGEDSFICVVVVIFNLSERRLYLHETFLTEKIPEIAASSLVRGSRAASPQSQGSIAKYFRDSLFPNKPFNNSIMRKSFSLSCAVVRFTSINEDHVFLPLYLIPGRNRIGVGWHRRWL